MAAKNTLLLLFLLPEPAQDGYPEELVCLQQFPEDASGTGGFLARHVDHLRGCHYDIHRDIVAVEQAVWEHIKHLPRINKSNTCNYCRSPLNNGFKYHCILYVNPLF